MDRLAIRAISRARSPLGINPDVVKLDHFQVVQNPLVDYSVCLAVVPLVVIVVKGVVQGLGQITDVMSCIGQMVLGVTAPLFGFDVIPDRCVTWRFLQGLNFYLDIWASACLKRSSQLAKPARIDQPSMWP